MENKQGMTKHAIDAAIQHMENGGKILFIEPRGDYQGFIEAYNECVKNGRDSGLKFIDPESLDTNSLSIGTTKNALKVFDNPSSIDDLENIDEETMKRIMGNTNCKMVLKVEEQKASVDRLAELEEQILQYYLSQGYKLFKDQTEGDVLWNFSVEINSFYKQKGITVSFKKGRFPFMPVFQYCCKTTDEMFDKAFEFFKVEAV